MIIAATTHMTIRTCIQIQNGDIPGEITGAFRESAE
jgi:hypothetical protein